MVTFSEISPSELGSMYSEGASILSIATEIGRSYTFVRSKVLSSGTPLRSRQQGTRLYRSQHPGWSKQLVKYRVEAPAEVTHDKIELLAMVITEGYLDRTSFGFTNVQDCLHSQFKSLVAEVYGDVHVNRNRILSRISSTEISRDLGNLMDGKAFSDTVFKEILESRKLTARVLRIIADTEGSMLISVRKAPNNYTVESRVVLASTNVKFAEQITRLLKSLDIGSRLGVDGVAIGRKEEIRRFIRLVGFTPGVRVVRKNAGLSTWYGLHKETISKVCLKYYSEQDVARTTAAQGCLISCKSREDVVRKLMNWYREVEGGER